MRQGCVRMAPAYHSGNSKASGWRQDSVRIASGWRHQDLMASQGVNECYLFTYTIIMSESKHFVLLEKHFWHFLPQSVLKDVQNISLGLNLIQHFIISL